MPECGRTSVASAAPSPFGMPNWFGLLCAPETSLSAIVSRTLFREVIVSRHIVWVGLLLCVGAAIPGTGFGDDSPLRPSHHTALTDIAAREAQLKQVNRQIWEFAEVGLDEKRSSALLVEKLRAGGFDVRVGMANMPTAFVASFGSGQPVIGILAEFDALPDLSQKISPTREPVEEGKPGHGCGHCGLGTGSLGAALAVKAAMERHQIPGTLRLYGTPAEETTIGKVYLLLDGAFEGLDVCLHWHPASKNNVWDGGTKALVSAKFTFHGVAAHASGSPEQGRLKPKQDSSITPAGNTYAIIVGISDYKVVPDLQYAHKDAQAFEDFLLTDAGGKIPKTNIETFLNENATRNNVGDAISVIARKVKPADRVYFFFAGHGDMEDLTQIENGLLLLYNSPNGNYFGMNDDVLEILDLKRYLSPLAQRGVEMIFIVDACHSGNLKGGVEGVQQTASALASSWGKEYKILSCQPNQLSLESSEWGGGRGLFSLQLEEGLKGLADKNNDGKVSFAELQRYITDNVATYSEDKQIPVVSGDLSKSFVKVDPVILAALKKQKAGNYPMLAVANTKGNEEKYVDSLDPAGKKIYLAFKKNMEDKKLIWPKDTNALKEYKTFVKKYPNNPLAATMRRNLATSLNERFNNIVGPLLKGETSYSTKAECYNAAAELDSCLRLLGEQHYMYNNLKARKLFMDASALTWALSESEYNISLKPTVEKGNSIAGTVRNIGAKCSLYTDCPR